MTDDTPAASGKPENEAILAGNEGKDETAGQSDAQPQTANPLAEQIAALEKEREELKDNLLRALAETDNVRKRANRQIEETRAYAVEKFARDLLGVADNLQRAIDAVRPEARDDLPEQFRTALEGVELTQKELIAVLARHGVTAVDANPGAAFNPAYHQAVTQIPSEHPAGTVAELFQSGWLIGDRTLRAAMVAVSAGPPSVQ